jgi:hypothetical protein
MGRGGLVTRSPILALKCSMRRTGNPFDKLT